VISLAKGTRVVFTGEEEDTEVVFVTHMHWADAQRESNQIGLVEDSRPVRGVTRLIPSIGLTPAVMRKGA
jgi:hypothetical protein